MADGREIRFKINAYTPATIPMSRLAEYMADFAELLGEPASVHFVRLDVGSTVLVQRIDDEALPKVLARVNDVKAGLAPSEAMSASKNINKRLKEDNADGVAMVDDGTEIIPFPGKNQAEPNTIPTFKQRGNLDGVVISLGGRKDPVPVQIQAGDVFYRCVISRGRARSLGPYILGPEVRVHGVGRWYRDEDSNWILSRFTIESFEPLDDEPLSAVVARLREVQGSEWPSLPDPWAELERIRSGDDGGH